MKDVSGVESPVLLRKTFRRGLTSIIDRLCLWRLSSIAERNARERDGTIAVFADDYIGNCINIFGVYEREELQLLFTFLAPLSSHFATGLAIDAGANIGNHTRWLARYFNRVRAYEPHPLIFGLLKLNTQHLDKIEVYNEALGDADTTLSLQQSLLNMGSSNLIEVASSEAAMSVSVRRLDSLGSNEGLAFMKLDVEGFEFKVLVGALDTIRANKPVIVLEQHETNFADGIPPSLQLLRNEGYRFCWMQRSRLPWWIISRPLRWLFDAWLGREYCMVSGWPVPKASHSMVVAVPPQWSSLLGLAD